jgi:type I restriction enzyme S subunit
MEHQLELLLVGSTFKRINISDIKALLVLVPPRQEQDQICEFLDSSPVEFDAIITRTEREIALLREYRTRLIADVVTGKLDVREAARHLPDEAGEPEPLTKADTLDENEEMSDDEAADEA